MKRSQHIDFTKNNNMSDEIEHERLLSSPLHDGPFASLAVCHAQIVEAAQSIEQFDKHASIGEALSSLPKLTELFYCNTLHYLNSLNDLLESASDNNYKDLNWLKFAVSALSELPLIKSYLSDITTKTNTILEPMLRVDTSFNTIIGLGNERAASLHKRLDAFIEAAKDIEKQYIELQTISEKSQPDSGRYSARKTL